MERVKMLAFTMLAWLGYASFLIILLTIFGLVYSIIKIGDFEAVGTGILVLTMVYGPLIMVITLVTIIASVALLLSSRTLMKTSNRIRQSANETGSTLTSKEKIAVVLDLGITILVMYEILPLTIYLLGLK